MADVETKTVLTNADLRGLLRTARRYSRMSQKEAASKAGCSVSWWRRVESASEVHVKIEMLTDMLFAVNITPEHLTEIRHHELAAKLADRQSFHYLSNDGNGAGLEEYLAKAPAPEQLREELIAYTKARTDNPPLYRRSYYRTEPFADQFRPERGKKDKNEE